MPFLDDFKTRDFFALVFIVVGIIFFRENIAGEIGKIFSTLGAFYFGLRQPQIK